MAALLRIALLLTIAWMGWTALLYFGQRGVAFPGAGLRSGPTAPPELATAVIIDRVTPAGHAIFLRSVTAWATAPAILFAHGNAEFAAQNVASFRPWADAGLHVLLVEYPGYDGAPGRPTQATIDALWLAAFDWLAARPEVDARRIVGFGRSLGSGPTAALAARRPLAAVVLQSGFADTVRFAHARLLPGFLVRDRWDNVGALRAFGGPVFASHGRHDAIIPPSHAESLAALPNVHLEWQDCGHNDCPLFDAAYRQRALAFLAAAGVLPSGPGTPAAPSARPPGSGAVQESAPVLARPQAGPLRELAMEVAQCRESAAARDLGDRPLRVAQQQAGFGDPHVVEVGREGPPGAAPECATERAGGHAESPSPFSHGERAVKVAVDPRQHAAEARVLSGQGGGACAGGLPDEARFGVRDAPHQRQRAAEPFQPVAVGDGLQVRDRRCAQRPLQ